MKCRGKTLTILPSTSPIHLRNPMKMFVLITSANTATLRPLFRSIFNIKSTSVSTSARGSSYPLRSQSKRKSLGSKDRYFTLNDNTENHSADASAAVDKMYPLTRSDSPPGLDGDADGDAAKTQRIGMGMGIAKNTEFTVSYDRA